MPVVTPSPSGILPSTPPWEVPFTSISRKRLVVIANSSVTWSLTLCEEYCDARGIPRDNIISFALGNGGTTDLAGTVWTPSPATMQQINTELMQPLKTFCLALQAQGILLGPACPVVVDAPNITATLSPGSFATLVGMCAAWVPTPANDLQFVFADGVAGGYTYWHQNKVIAPDPLRLSIPVTGIIDNIRSSPGFATNTRMNLWMEAITPFFSFIFYRPSVLPPAEIRLTIVQGGVTVYDMDLTNNLDGGTEIVDITWASSLSRILEVNGVEGSGRNSQDLLATLSFPNVTVNPALPIDSAILTLDSNYANIFVGGTFRVWGEYLPSVPAVVWSSTHRPVLHAVAKTVLFSDVTLVRDESKIGLSTISNLNNSFYSDYWYHNYVTDSLIPNWWFQFVDIYEAVLDTVRKLIIFSPTYEGTSFLGTGIHYDTSYAFKNQSAYPTLPVGRIGLSAFGAYGGLPVVETAIVDRAIIERASGAMAAHYWPDLKTKPIIFHLANNTSSLLKEPWAYLYALCKAWGLNAKYAYFDGVSTATSELYAPIAGSLYTDTDVIADTVREEFYMLVGEWKNFSTETEAYLPPYSVSWIPLPGAGVMHSPSQGWKYAVQALSTNAVCVLTDYMHITTINIEWHPTVFYNLLRGMTWLEASFYGAAQGNVPTGDPLWAPFALIGETDMRYNQPPTEVYAARGGEPVDISGGDHVVSGRSLYIGGTGNVKIRTYNGNDITFVAVPTGKELVVAFTRIFQTGTTATSIIALR